MLARGTMLAKLADLLGEQTPAIDRKWMAQTGAKGHNTLVTDRRRDLFNPLRPLPTCNAWPESAGLQAMASIPPMTQDHLVDAPLAGSLPEEISQQPLTSTRSFTHQVALATKRTPLLAEPDRPLAEAATLRSLSDRVTDSLEYALGTTREAWRWAIICGSARDGIDGGQKFPTILSRSLRAAHHIGTTRWHATAGT
jgi:hypothetical protein